MERGLKLASWGMVAALALVWLTTAEAQQPKAHLVEAKGIINPVMAGYLDKAITSAEREGAAVVIIQLDTPGGLDSSMRDIVQRILNASVPVVVYVSPPGARAASAGVFITMAAHIAAMAPNTAIGAAHPVSIGSGGQVEHMEPTMEEKVVNDAVAYIKSTAQLRNRNIEWAEKAVRESVSATAQEAVELKIVDLLAPNVSSLLKEVDGRVVTLPSGSLTLNTKGAVTEKITMSLWESFLFAVSNPNIAFLLLSLALLGLFFELANPGSIFPGVIGGILLVLALYSLGSLPVNWAGVLLIVLAFILFVLEIFVTSHGLLAIGGTVSLLLGGLMLIDPRDVIFAVDRWLIVGVVATIAAFFIFVVGAVVRARRQQVAIGRENLVGKIGTARTELNPEGLVFIDGARWSATVEGAPVKEGEEVLVTRMDGLRLFVTKAKNP